MPLINCKVELEHKWMRDCVLASTRNRYTNANSDNITFTIEYIKLYPCCHFTSKKQSNLSKRLSKGSQRSV